MAGRSGRSQRVTNPAHLPPKKLRYLMQTPTWYRERAHQIGPATAQFIERLLGDVRSTASAPRTFPEWPEVFGERSSSAALDRLAHDAHQIAITGKSYRTRATRRRTADKKGGNEARGEA